MKNALRENFDPSVILTVKVLEDLKENGFQYVKVNAFTCNRREDHIAPQYIVLIPIKDLPKQTNATGIYEPLNSELLQSWASNPDIGASVYVTTRELSP
jgi:hypothetical protein